MRYDAITRIVILHCCPIFCCSTSVSGEAVLDSRALSFLGPSFREMPCGSAWFNKSTDGERNTVVASPSVWKAENVRKALLKTMSANGGVMTFPAFSLDLYLYLCISLLLLSAQVGGSMRVPLSRIDGLGCSCAWRHVLFRGRCAI